MDEVTQERFDRIVKKDESELFDHEIQFLRSRRSYLNGPQLKKFESVLEVKKDKKTAKKKDK